MRKWLDCPDCGEDVLESDEKGFFDEDMPSVRCVCGSLVRVCVDDCGSGYFDEEDEIGFAYSQVVEEDDAPTK